MYKCGQTSQIHHLHTQKKNNYFCGIRSSDKNGKLLRWNQPRAHKYAHSAQLEQHVAVRWACRACETHHTILYHSVLFFINARGRKNAVRQAPISKWWRLTNQNRYRSSWQTEFLTCLLAGQLDEPNLGVCSIHSLLCGKIMADPCSVTTFVHLSHSKITSLKSHAKCM